MKKSKKIDFLVFRLKERGHKVCKLNKSIVTNEDKETTVCYAYSRVLRVLGFHYQLSLKFPK